LISGGRILHDCDIVASASQPFFENPAAGKNDPQEQQPGTQWVQRTEWPVKAVSIANPCI